MRFQEIHTPASAVLTASLKAITSRDPAYTASLHPSLAELGGKTYTTSELAQKIRIVIQAFLSHHTGAKNKNKLLTDLPRIISVFTSNASALQELTNLLKSELLRRGIGQMGFTIIDQPTMRRRLSGITGFINTPRDFQAKLLSKASNPSSPREFALMLADLMDQYEPAVRRMLYIMADNIIDAMIGDEDNRSHTKLEIAARRGAF